jgi:hypothetical protein
MKIPTLTQPLDMSSIPKLHMKKEGHVVGAPVGIAHMTILMLYRIGSKSDSKIIL